MKSAKYAHEQLFASRRGFLDVGQEDLIVIYDNNPYRSDSLSRHQELERLKAAVLAGDVQCVAEAGYPVGGPDDGYTVALVFRASEDRYAAEDLIAQEWRRFVMTSRSDAD